VDVGVDHAVLGVGDLLADVGQGVVELPHGGDDGRGLEGGSGLQDPVGHRAVVAADAGELLYSRRRRLASPRAHRVRGVHGRPQGWDYIHVAVDDHTRLAYAEILSDEKPAARSSCIGPSAGSVSRVSWCAG